MLFKTFETSQLNFFPVLERWSSSHSIKFSYIPKKLSNIIKMTVTPKNQLTKHTYRFFASESEREQARASERGNAAPTGGGRRRGPYRRAWGKAWMTSGLETWEAGRWSCSKGSDRVARLPPVYLPHGRGFLHCCLEFISVKGQSWFTKIMRHGRAMFGGIVVLHLLHSPLFTWTCVLAYILTSTLQIFTLYWLRKGFGEFLNISITILLGVVFMVFWVVCVRLWLL